MKLRITWDGGSSIFTHADSVTVGRVPESTITILDPVVSRAHLRFTYINDVWTFEDLSSNGTFIGGERVSVGGLGGPIDINLGGPTGPRLQLELLPLDLLAQSPPLRPPPLAQSPSLRPSPQGSPPAPPMPAHNPATLETIRLDDRELRLELAAQMYVFQPGQQALVGRDPECAVRSDRQLISGKHCVFTHNGLQWFIEDLHSTRGTFIDHKKVVGRQPIEGAFFVMLGDDDAGEPLRVITAGEHRKPHDRRPLFLATAALALVLLGGLALLAFWPDNTENELLIADLREQIAEQQRTSEEQREADSVAAERAIALDDAQGGGDNSPNQLMAARLSTARIEVPGPDGDIIGTGSGALVSDDGLILTNIHVVLPALEYERTNDPTFSGLEDPEQLLVSFPSEDGGPADLFFVAEQFSAHPTHDAALIRVVEGMDGALLDDLPDPLPIGVSADLRAGDEIAVVGYPGTAFTQRVSVALSNFQSFQPCFAGSAFDDDWGCLRDYDEGYLNLAGETLEGGSSGGPIMHQGEVVGIQLGVFGEPGASSAQNLGVPIDLINEDLDIRE